MSLLGGAGLLYSTEVRYADLGTHAGRRLRGRAERRLLQLALGRAPALRLSLGRLRPIAVEVTEPDERRYEIAIPRPRDPRLAAAGRILTCWMLATLALGIARRLRTKEPPE